MFRSVTFCWSHRIPLKENHSSMSETSDHTEILSKLSRPVNHPMIGESNVDTSSDSILTTAEVLSNVIELETQPVGLVRFVGSSAEPSGAVVSWLKKHQFQEILGLKWIERYGKSIEHPNSTSSIRDSERLCCLQVVGRQGD